MTPVQPGAPSFPEHLRRHLPPLGAVKRPDPKGGVRLSGFCTPDAAPLSHSLTHSLTTQVAPYFHEFAAANPSVGVLYAGVLLSRGSSCSPWHALGGFSDQWGVTLDDTAQRHFQTLFGSTRPQFFAISPSGEFLDISPDSECGQVCAPTPISPFAQTVR